MSVPIIIDTDELQEFNDDLAELIKQLNEASAQTNDKHLKGTRLLIEAGVKNPAEVLDRIIEILYGDVMK